MKKTFISFVITIFFSQSGLAVECPRIFNDEIIKKSEENKKIGYSLKYSIPLLFEVANDLLNNYLRKNASNDSSAYMSSEFLRLISSTQAWGFLIANNYNKEHF